MTRTFWAVDFDAPFLDAMTATGERLRGLRALSHARWVRKDLMHATLRFFGDVDEPTLAELGAATSRLVEGLSAIPVSALALAGFPSSRRARVVVVELEDRSGALTELAGRAEREAARLGFPPADHPFRPHLTLARPRAPADIASTVVATKLDVRGVATSVTLYASELGPEGPRYEAVARAPLPLVAS